MAYHLPQHVLTCQSNNTCVTGVEMRATTSIATPLGRLIHSQHGPHGSRSLTYASNQPMLTLIWCAVLLHAQQHRVASIQQLDEDAARV